MSDETAREVSGMNDISSVGSDRIADPVELQEYNLDSMSMEELDAREAELQRQIDEESKKQASPRSIDDMSLEELDARERELKSEISSAAQKRLGDRLSLSDKLEKMASFVADETDGDENLKADHDFAVRARDVLSTHKTNFASLSDEQVNALSDGIQRRYDEASKRRGHLETAWDALKRGYWSTGNMIYQGGMMLKPGGLTQEDDDKVRGSMKADEDMRLEMPQKIGGVENIHSVGDAMDWFLESVGENVARSAAAMGLTTAGAMAAPALGVSAGVGAIIMGTAGTMAMNTGEAVQDQMDENRNDGDIRNSRGWALAQGLGYSLLDGAFGVSAWGAKLWSEMLRKAGVGKLVKGATVDQIADTARKASVGKMAKEVLAHGVVGEGLQEVAQSQGVGRGIRYLQTGSIFRRKDDGKEETGNEALLEAANEFLGGAAAGLTFGLAGGSFAHADARRMFSAYDKVGDVLNEDETYKKLDTYGKLLVKRHLVNDAYLETTNTLSKQEVEELGKSNAEIDAEIERMSESGDPSEKLVGQSAKAYLDVFKSQYGLEDIGDVMAEAEAMGIRPSLDPNAMRSNSELMYDEKSGTNYRVYTDNGISIAEVLDDDGKPTGRYVFNNDPSRKSPILGKDELVCSTVDQAFAKAQQLDVYNQWRERKLEEKAKIAKTVFDNLFGNRGVNLEFVDRPTAAGNEALVDTYSFDQSTGKAVRTGTKSVAGTTAAYVPETNTVEISLDNINSLGALYTSLIHERSHEDIVEFLMKAKDCYKKVGDAVVPDWEKFAAAREELMSKVKGAEEMSARYRKEGAKPDKNGRYGDDDITAEWGRSAGTAGEEMMVERNSIRELAEQIRRGERGLVGGLLNKIRSAIGLKMANDMGLDPMAIMGDIDNSLKAEMNKLYEIGFVGREKNKSFVKTEPGERRLAKGAESLVRGKERFGKKVGPAFTGNDELNLGTGEETVDAGSAQEPEKPANTKAAPKSKVVSTTLDESGNARVTSESVGEDGKTVVKETVIDENGRVVTEKEQEKPAEEPKKTKNVASATKTASPAPEKAETTEETAPAPSAEKPVPAASAKAEDKSAEKAPEKPAEKAPAQEPVRINPDEDTITVETGSAKPDTGFRRMPAEKRSAVVKASGLKDVTAEDEDRWMRLDELPKGASVKVGGMTYVKASATGKNSDAKWAIGDAGGAKTLQVLLARKGDFSIVEAKKSSNAKKAAKSEENTNVEEEKKDAPSKIEAPSTTTEKKSEVTAPLQSDEKASVSAPQKTEATTPATAAKPAEAKETAPAFVNDRLDLSADGKRLVEAEIDELLDSEKGTSDEQRKTVKALAGNYGKPTSIVSGKGRFADFIIASFENHEGKVGIAKDGHILTNDERRALVRGKTDAEVGGKTVLTSFKSIISMPQIASGNAIKIGDELVKALGGIPERYAKLTDDALLGLRTQKNDFMAMKELERRWRDGRISDWLKKNGRSDDVQEGKFESDFLEEVERALRDSDRLESATRDFMRFLESLPENERKEAMKDVPNAFVSGSPLGRTVTADSLFYSIANELAAEIDRNNLPRIQREKLIEEKWKAKELADRIRKEAEAEERKAQEEDEWEAMISGVDVELVSMQRKIENDGVIPEEYRKMSESKLMRLCVPHNGMPADRLAQKEAKFRVMTGLNPNMIMGRTRAAGLGESRYEDIVNEAIAEIESQWSNRKSWPFWRGEKSSKGLIAHAVGIVRNIIRRESARLASGRIADSRDKMFQDFGDGIKQFNPGDISDARMADSDPSASAGVIMPDYSFDVEPDDKIIYRKGMFASALEAVKGILGLNVLTERQQAYLLALRHAWIRKVEDATDELEMVKAANKQVRTIDAAKKKLSKAYNLEFDDDDVIRIASESIGMKPAVYRAKLGTLIDGIAVRFMGEKLLTKVRGGLALGEKEREIVRRLKRGMFTKKDVIENLADIRNDDVDYPLGYDERDIMSAMDYNGDEAMRRAVELASEGKSDGEIQAMIDGGELSELENEEGLKKAATLLDRAFVKYGWIDRRYAPKLDRLYGMEDEIARLENERKSKLATPNEKRAIDEKLAVKRREARSFREYAMRGVRETVSRVIDRFRGDETFERAFEGDYSSFLPKVAKWMENNGFVFRGDDLANLVVDVVRSNARPYTLAVMNAENRAQRINDHEIISDMLEEFGGSEIAVRSQLRDDGVSDKRAKSMFTHWKSVEKDLAEKARRENERKASGEAAVGLPYEKKVWSERVFADNGGDYGKTRKALAEMGYSEKEVRQAYDHLKGLERRDERSEEEKAKALPFYERRAMLEERLRQTGDDFITDDEAVSYAIDKLGMGKLSADSIVRSMRPKATEMSAEDLERIRQRPANGMTSAQLTIVRNEVDMADLAEAKKFLDGISKQVRDDADRLKGIVEEFGYSVAGKVLKKQGLSDKAIDRIVTNYTNVTRAEETVASKGKTPLSLIAHHSRITPAEDAAYLDAVNRPDANDRTTRLAPNGKRSNLSNALYHLVRTKRFKEWFGDWEKVAKRVLIDRAPTPTIEVGAFVRNDGESVQDAAKKYFHGSVKHKTVIGEVEIDARSGKDSLAHKYGQGKLDAITSIQRDFANAVYLGSEREFDGKDIDNHYFCYPINYDGKRRLVFCRARQDVNKNRLYVHEVFLEDEIKSNALQTAAIANESQKPHGGIALYRSILQSVYAVNQGAVSKVVDENGEPKPVYHSVGSWYVQNGRADFNVFDGSIAKNGFMFRGSEAWIGPDGWGARNTNGEGRFIKSFLNIRNPLVVDAKGANYTRIPNPMIDEKIGYPESVVKEAVDENERQRRSMQRDVDANDPKWQNLLHSWEYFTRGNGKYILPDGLIHVANELSDENGERFDGVIVRNVDEGEKDGVGDDYITQDPSAIKSADPVTYDDAGNVIPISRRFDETNSDVRFHSRMSSADMNFVSGAQESLRTHGRDVSSREARSDDSVRREAELLLSDGDAFNKAVVKGLNSDPLTEVEVAAITLEIGRRTAIGRDGHLSAQEFEANEARLDELAKSVSRGLSTAAAVLRQARVGIDLQTRDTAYYIRAGVRAQLESEAARESGESGPIVRAEEIEAKLKEYDAEIKAMADQLAKANDELARANAKLAKKESEADDRAIERAKREAWNEAFAAGVRKRDEEIADEAKRYADEYGDKVDADFLSQGVSMMNALGSMFGGERRFAGLVKGNGLTDDARNMFAGVIRMFKGDIDLAREALSAKFSNFEESIGPAFDQFVAEETAKAKSPDGLAKTKRKVAGRNIVKMAEEADPTVEYVEDAEVDEEIEPVAKPAERKAKPAKRAKGYIARLENRVVNALQKARTAESDEMALMHLGEMARGWFKLSSVLVSDEDVNAKLNGLLKMMNKSLPGRTFSMEDAKDALLGRGSFKPMGREGAKATLAQLQKARRLAEEGKVAEAAKAAGIKVVSDAEILEELDRRIGSLLNSRLNAFEARINEKPDEELGKQIHALVKALNDIRSGKPVGELLGKYLDLAVGMKDYRRQRSVLDQINSRISMYERKIAENDFEPKPKRENPDTTKEVVEIQRAMRHIEKLRQTFKKQRSMWRLKRGSWMRRQLDSLIEMLGEVKAVAGSMDLSSILRQGGQLTWAHPLLFSKNLKRTLQALKSDKAAEAIMDSILERPNAKYYLKAGIDFTDWGSNAANAEDVFLLNQYRRFTKLKLFRIGIEASERAFSTYLNLMRADVFDAMVANSPLRTASAYTDEQLKAIGNFINIASQRGTIDMQNKLGKSLEAMNAVLWSPRNVISRFQFIVNTVKLAVPGAGAYGSHDAAMRKMFAKETFRYLSGAAIAIFFTKMMADLFRGDDEPQEDIETDPRSSDFLKVKVGNTRLDFLSGLQQILVFSSRVISHKRKNLRGEVLDMRKNPALYSDTILRFARSKLSPMASFIYDMAIDRETFNHQDISYAPNELLDKDNEKIGSVRYVGESLFMPLGIRDLYEQFKDDPLKAPVTSVLTLLGAGVQTFDPYTYKQLSGDYRFFKRMLKLAESDEERGEIMRKHPMLKRMGSIEPQLKFVRNIENEIRKVRKAGGKAEVLEDILEREKKRAINLMAGFSQPMDTE